MKALLVVFLMLFSTIAFAQPKRPEVLLEQAPQYTAGERSPILFRRLGDIGLNPLVVNKLLNHPRVPYQQVSSVDENGVVTILHRFIGQQQIFQVETYYHTSGLHHYSLADQEEIPAEFEEILGIFLIKYPLQTGDYFDLWQKIGIFEITARCGPVQRDRDSGYIFFRCSPSDLPHAHKLLYVYTADLKWRVLPVLVVESGSSEEKTATAKR